MEVNEIDSSINFDLDNSIDGFGSEFPEDTGNEERTEEGEESLSNENESGHSDDSNDNFIDYTELATSIRSATPIYQLDTDLDDLQITDVCLLFVLLLLGIILIGGKGR